MGAYQPLALLLYCICHVNNADPSLGDDRQLLWSSERVESRRAPEWSRTVTAVRRLSEQQLPSTHNVELESVQLQDEYQWRPSAFKSEPLTTDRYSKSGAAPRNSGTAFRRVDSSKAIPFRSENPIELESGNRNGDPIFDQRAATANADLFANLVAPNRDFAENGRLEALRTESYGKPVSPRKLDVQAISRLSAIEPIRPESGKTFSRHSPRQDGIDSMRSHANVSGFRGKQLAAESFASRKWDATRLQPSAAVQRRFYATNHSVVPMVQQKIMPGPKRRLNFRYPPGIDRQVSPPQPQIGFQQSALPQQQRAPTDIRILPLSMTNFSAIRRHPIDAAAAAAPLYTRLAPAPPLVFPQSPNNFVQSIFAQSQQPAALTPAITSNALPTDLMPSESTLESISKFARNILNLPGMNQQDLWSTVTSALSGKPNSALTSSAVRGSSPSNLLGSNDLDHIFSSVSAAQRKPDSSSGGLLQALPAEQRTLLEAAIRSGELDPRTLATAISTVTTDSKNGQENGRRLLEWIQQNRPRAPSTTTSAPEKLPYYGKYCGSFNEQLGASKHFSAAGAVWAVDDRRFIVSKFHFQPGALTSENITFWAGPERPSGDPVADMFPSANGFYLRPQPVDLTAFLANPIKVQKARIRSTNATTNATTQVQRRRRDLFSEVYENRRAATFRDRYLAEESAPPKTGKNENDTIHLVVQVGGCHLVASLFQGGLLPIFTNTDPSPSTFKTSIHSVVENREETTTTEAPVESSSTTATQESTTQESTTQPPTTTTTSSTTRASTTLSVPPPTSTELQTTTSSTDASTTIEPLQWYAGFQPLMLTLPETKSVKQINWLALRDHRRQDTVASVLIPNGPLFQPPARVQLRAMAPNGLYRISTGPINILDAKTLEISDFSFESLGVPAWFMVGKDIFPNGNGHIVPVFESATKSFDCDSLRDYRNETVTLRLPGAMDIKDVFWFSIFSIPQAVSMGQLYIPYNEIQPPPDLRGIAVSSEM